jgi:hypothetical protein
MPCLGKKMKVRIGKPIRFDTYRDAPDNVMTWRAITEEVMADLRAMEAEELGAEPLANAPRSVRRASRRSERRLRVPKVPL